MKLPGAGPIGTKQRRNSWRGWHRRLAGRCARGYRADLSLQLLWARFRGPVESLLARDRQDREAPVCVIEEDDAERRFFLLARFYGPEPALFDKSFELNEIELVK